MALFAANNDQDINRLLLLQDDNDENIINHYNTLSSLYDNNIYLKDVLKMYKKYFESKLNEKIAQEKALLILIHHLDTIIDDENQYNTQQYSHIEQQKNNIFRELLSIQNAINHVRKLN